MKRETTTYDLKHFSKSIKPIAKKVLGKHGLKEVDLLANWKNIVGGELGGFSMPRDISYKGKEKNSGTLTVAVKSAAFALELNARKSMIIQKINTFFGYNIIADIKTIVADIVANFYEEEEKKLVSKDELDYIKEKTKDIKSKELQTALEKLGASIIRKQK